MQLKSIEQRLSKLGQRRLTEENADDSKVVARLKKIYMTDGETKALPKKRGRRKIKTEKTSAVKQDFTQI